MLSSTEFWVGVIAGALLLWGVQKWRASQAK